MVKIYRIAPSPDNEEVREEIAAAGVRVRRRQEDQACVSSRRASSIGQPPQAPPPNSIT